MSELNDAYWMKQALALAQKAWDQGEVPVGAILVLDDEVIGQDGIAQLPATILPHTLRLWRYSKGANCAELSAAQRDAVCDIRALRDVCWRNGSQPYQAFGVWCE